MISHKLMKVVSLAISLSVFVGSTTQSFAKSESKKGDSKTTESKKSEKKQGKKSKDKKPAKEKTDGGKDESENASAAEKPDSELRAKFAAISQSLAEGDPKVMASYWTETGDYIGVDGSICKGRTEIEKRFVSIFENKGKQHVDLVPGDFRVLAPGVVVANGLVRRQDGVEGPAPETRFSMVLVKKDSGWLISSVTETPLLAINDKDPLKELSWLLGDWSAENNGKSVHMKAEWAPHKHFIVCNYQMKKSADSPVEESKQIIGWDPRNEQPISWHFDANGGFGYGSWAKQGKQWVVDASGVESDGSSTSATNIFNIDDSNSFSWQSINRRVNGLAYNDTEPLKVKRVIK